MSVDQWAYLGKANENFLTVFHLFINISHPVSEELNRKSWNLPFTSFYTLKDNDYFKHIPGFGFVAAVITSSYYKHPIDSFNKDKLK